MILHLIFSVIGSPNFLVESSIIHFFFCRSASGTKPSLFRRRNYFYTIMMTSFFRTFFFLAAAATTTSSLVGVSAFPGGAGRCVINMPSPSGPHSSPLQSLSSGGFEVTIDGATYDDVATDDGVAGTVTATAGEKFNITIATTDDASSYKGILIMVADESDTAIADFDDTTLKLATGSGCPGTASVTHTSASAKQTSTVTVMVADPVKTTLELNIVESLSSYYYTRLSLEVV